MRKRTIAAIAGGVLVVGGIASMGGEDEQTPETAQPTATAEATPTVEETEEPTTEEPTVIEEEEEPAPVPAPVAEETAEPEEVEEAVEEAVEFDRDTEMLMLQLVMDTTFAEMSSAEKSDICMGWDLAPEMMVDAFMSNFDVDFDYLTKSDVEAELTTTVDRLCS